MSSNLSVGESIETESLLVLARRCGIEGPHAYRHGISTLNCIYIGIFPLCLLSHPSRTVTLKPKIIDQLFITKTLSEKLSFSRMEEACVSASFSFVWFRTSTWFTVRFKVLVTASLKIEGFFLLFFYFYCFCWVMMDRSGTNYFLLFLTSSTPQSSKVWWSNGQKQTNKQNLLTCSWLFLFNFPRGCKSFCMFIGYLYFIFWKLHTDSLCKFFYWIICFHNNV